MNDSPDMIAVEHAAAMPVLADFLSYADHQAINPLQLPTSAEELARLARRDMELTRYPMKSWVLPKFAPDGTRALDVLVVGAGQAGLATGFGLLQQRVENILLIDENAPGAEGPWATYARMETLRTQKDVGGIECGVPSLSLRAWYEVQYGAQAWRDLYKVPTAAWARYLNWYRVTTQLPVRNHCRMVRFGPSSVAGLIEVEVQDKAGQRSLLWTQTLALATGIEGNGRRFIPPVVRDNVPKAFWAHTQEDIDFTALKDKSVGVVGGGASAFDNAIKVAEAGAARVDLYHRAPDLRSANGVAWSEFNGYLAHFPDLDLAQRWRFARQMKALRSGPPVRTVEKAQATANIVIHPGSSFERLEMKDAHVLVHATDGMRAFDFLILGTGYETNVALAPEFIEHMDKIALWQDVFTPPPGEDDPGLMRSCHLGPNFELQEKTPGCAPWLAAVFNFSRGANASMGPMPIGLSGIKFGVPRLVQGITKRLFVSNAAAYLEGMKLWQQGDNVYER
jgi:cation diffusion facilitator CzcD-associated flavoprotein CzcO